MGMSLETASIGMS